MADENVNVPAPPLQVLSGLSGLTTLDTTGDITSLHQRWERWREQFEIYTVAAGIANDTQKRALLLHMAGPDIQEIVKTLAIVGNTSQELITKLNEYFEVKKNPTKERLTFMAMAPEAGENITSFTARLKAKAKNCEFGGEEEKQVRDKMLYYISDKGLKNKLVAEQDLTLSKALEVTASWEDPEARQLSAAMQSASISHVRGHSGYGKSRRGRSQPRVSQSRPQSHQQSSASSGTSFSGKCWRCGKPGHMGKNCEVSRSHKCEKCGYLGHFELCCHSKKRNEERGRGPNRRQSRVHAVTEEEGDDEYVFVVGVNKSDSTPKFCVSVDGVDINILADTGAKINIIDEVTFLEIQAKQKKARQRVTSVKDTDKRVFAYKSTTPLNMIGVFEATIEARDKLLCEKVYVVSGQGENLLSCQSAVELGLISVANSVSDFNPKDKYPELFQGVGLMKGHKIKLHIDPTVQPVAQKHRRIPFHLRKQVEGEIQSLLDQDIIEPATGPTPWVSPIVVVPKPKAPGKVRICVDMRAVNKAVLRERHIAPTLDDIVEQLNGSTVFSKIDLKSGYHQLEIEEESRHITTFSTHQGLFRYKRLNFGISSASEVFQNTIAQVLAGIPGALNISDDIIIHGKDQQDHDAASDAVCKQLLYRGLTANPEKCEFNKDSLDFYGFVVGKSGMTPDPEKVQGIQELEAPSDPSEVRSFLGMTGYCSRFIPNYATTTAPLRELIRKDVKWTWEPRHQEAVETLKSALESAPVLAYFDPAKDTEIVVDASPVGLGAVLAQVDAGERKVVAYASRSLTETEQRYSQTEREALGVVYGLEHFHLYTYGSAVTVVTDHKPLTYIFNNPLSKPPARIERWSLRIDQYNPKIVYRPGKDNPADYMSRHPRRGSKQSTPQEQKVAEEYINFVADHTTPKAVCLEEVKLATSEDSVLQKVIGYIRTGTWYKLKADIYGCAESQDLRGYYTVRDELSVHDEGNLILRGTRLVIPKSLQSRIVDIAHEGHQGVVKTKALMREKVWYPGMGGQVEEKVLSCMACQMATPTVTREPLKMSPLPEFPFDEISIDFASVDGETLLVVVDDYSRFPIVEIVTTTSAGATIPKLHNIFATFGVPRVVKSDNGPPFNGSEFKRFSDIMGFHHRKVTPLWPQANGEVERFVKTLKKAVKAAKAVGKNWRKEINIFLMSYRNTPHTTTGVAPSMLMFKRVSRNKLPSVDGVCPQRQDVELRDSYMKSKQKAYADDKAYVKPSPIGVGDTVIVRRDNPSMHKAEPPYARDTLIVSHKNGSMVTAKNDTRSVTRNTSFFKRVPSEDENCQDQAGLDMSFSAQDCDSDSAIQEVPVDVTLPMSSPRISKPHVATPRVPQDTVYPSRPQRTVNKPRRLIEEY